MASCNKCERKPLQSKEACVVFNMDDGRNFTDYRPKIVQNNHMINNNVMNSYEYRMYLQKNAKNLMKLNEDKAKELNPCNNSNDLFSNGTMLPEAYKFECNATTCNLKNNDQGGLGTGRDYNVQNNIEGFSNCNNRREGFSNCNNRREGFLYRQNEKSVPKENFLNF